MIDKIRKIAIDIFKALGDGYSESIYQKAFEVGLRMEDIPYEDQRILPVFYKNFNIGESKPDLIIKDLNGNEKIVVELKAVSSSLGQKEEVQLQRYLDTLNIKKGVLINFPQSNKERIEEPEIKVVG